MMGANLAVKPGHKAVIAPDMKVTPINKAIKKNIPKIVINETFLFRGSELIFFDLKWLNFLINCMVNN